MSSDLVSNWGSRSGVSCVRRNEGRWNARAVSLGAIGWWLRHGPFSESLGVAGPAVIQAKELTANVERGPSQGQPVTLRRGEEVTVVKREERRVLVKDRRGNQVYVSSKKIKPAKVKRRQKKVAKTRSKHVQR